LVKPTTPPGKGRESKRRENTNVCVRTVETSEMMFSLRTVELSGVSRGGKINLPVEESSE